MARPAMNIPIVCLIVNVSRRAPTMTRTVPMAMAAFRPSMSAHGAARKKPLMMAQTEYAVLTPPIVSERGFPTHSIQSSIPWTAL